MKYSILNEGVTLKAQSGAILKTAKQLEALAKETAFADMIKEGIPIYKASEVLKTANNLETIPYNEYQGFTTAGRLKSMDFNVGNESAFDNVLSDKRAINNEIVRTNRKIQNLQNEIADYTQKHKELSDNLNLLRASGLKAHKIDGRNKSRLNWFNEQFNYDNHSDLEQLQYYDLWINRMKDEIKSLSANIPTSLFESGGILKAQKGEIIKAIGEAVKGSSKPALVKYYAPTMGKTFAAKSNPLLVDFDDIIREPSRQILDTYGFKSKSDMYNSGNTDAISAYENMLVEKLNGLRTNPQYNGKTVVVSPTAVANPDKIGFKYDNIPSIPVKSIFIERNVGRGGTPGASEMWYDSLMRQYPGFNIENRFVSELEPMPTNEQWDALYNAAVESGDKKEADRLEQMFYDLKTPGNQTPGITYRGERFPKDAYKFTIGSEQRPGMMFTTTEPALASSYADLHTPYTKVYGLQKQLTGEENMMKISEELGTLTPELKEQWTEKINGIKASIAEAMKEQPDFSHYRFRRMRVYSTNPEVFDAKGSLWSRVKPYDPELGKIPTTDDLAIAAQKKGHDAMVIQNVRDSGNSTIFFGQNPATDIVALDPNRVKLAGPTYDDDGKLIPLSKRFDFTNPDIRYGIIPLVGLGLGAAATQKEKSGGVIKAQGGLSKLEKVVKTILGPDGKLFNSKIVRKPNNFYRAVSEEAITDAKTTGVIRGNQLRSNDAYPFFARSQEPFTFRKYVIEGTPESATWIIAYPYAYTDNKQIVKLPKAAERDYSLGYAAKIGSPEENGFQLTGGYDLDYLKGYEALPLTGDSVNSTPAKNFVYYKKYPLFGWRQKQFKNGGTIKSIF